MNSLKAKEEATKECPCIYHRYRPAIFKAEVRLVGTPDTVVNTINVCRECLNRSDLKYAVDVETLPILQSVFLSPVGPADSKFARFYYTIDCVADEIKFNATLYGLGWLEKVAKAAGVELDEELYQIIDEFEGKDVE